MNIMDKIKKNSKTEGADILAKSKFFTEKDMIPTDIPMINLALSGDVDGGLTPGLTTISGESRHFKTSYSLIMASAYMKKYPESALLFYDTEFGSPQDYFKTFGIDTNRVLHVPVKNIEELKFDITSQLKELDRDDRVIIIIDSIGNIASVKEVEDALSEKSVADMSRAKSLKSLFRIVTPYLNLKNVPLIAINHVYDSIGLFPTKVLSGGKGAVFSSDTIWIVGRRQNKKGTDVIGYDFVINVEKSRYVREKTKIPISVTWEGGVEKYSGLLEFALAGNYVTKPKNGWYCRVNQETGEIIEPNVREAETLKEEFWKPILEETNFKQYLSECVKIDGNKSVEIED